MLADGEIIEEFLVQAFPALSERQLVRATRNLERKDYTPGSILLREGAPPDQFYIITRGQIEVLVEDSDGDRLTVAHMGRGQYFGEVELLRGGTNMATIRAALDTGVQVAVLDRQTFDSLMTESTPTREALDRVAEARIAENLNGRNGRNGVNHA
jgi:CRP-like cAMP-binding protein